MLRGAAAGVVVGFATSQEPWSFLGWLTERTCGGVGLTLLTLDGIIASPGGNPVIVGGKLIGAIGVSGGTVAQDHRVSLAGVAALK
jgi:uncharacterized protein GlcG (DUF336 family)